MFILLERRHGKGNHTELARFSFIETLGINATISFVLMGRPSRVVLNTEKVLSSARVLISLRTGASDN